MIAASYTKIGDYRKAEGYALTAADVFDAIPRMSRKSSKSNAKDLISCFEDNSGTIRQIFYRRNFVGVKALSLASDAIAQEMSSSNCSYQHIQKFALIREEGSDGRIPKLDQISCLVHTVKDKISRGDMLKRGSSFGIDNGFSKFYRTAFNLSIPISSTAFEETMLQEIGLLRLQPELLRS
eukprot:2122900-Ditylum_brightwellii.AAC.1